jgi:hypothetical protein
MEKIMISKVVCVLALHRELMEVVSRCAKSIKSYQRVFLTLQMLKINGITANSLIIIKSI